jgi:hypothetical protein
VTARPADPAPGPDTGSYEVIRLGGQAAVVVPVTDFLRLRAGAPRVRRGAGGRRGCRGAGGLKAREAAGQASYVPHDEVRRRLGLPG